VDQGDGEGGDAVGDEGLLRGGAPGEPEPQTEQGAVHGDEHGLGADQAPDLRASHAQSAQQPDLSGAFDDLQRQAASTVVAPTSDSPIIRGHPTAIRRRTATTGGYIDAEHLRAVSRPEERICPGLDARPATGAGSGTRSVSVGYARR
jgi:hypothetical protein